MAAIRRCHLLFKNILNVNNFEHLSMTANFNLVTNELIRSAIIAINGQDSRKWFELFSDDAILSDDGSIHDFRKWSTRELFGSTACYVISIDKVEDDGRTIYCLFHSDRWGDFKTFMKFHSIGNKISRLDVGQTTY